MQQIGGGKRGRILFANLVHHVLAVYYDLGVCAAACAPARKVLEEELEILFGLGVLGERYASMLSFIQRQEVGAAGGQIGMLEIQDAIVVLSSFRQYWKMDFATAAAYINANVKSPEVR